MTVFKRLLLIILLSSLGLCPALAEQKPGPGGRLIYGLLGDASGLIPMVTSDSSSSAVQGFVYEGLVKYDKNIELTGELAESWTVSPDGKTITFKLRKGVKWHDGKPYTSKDALFSYQFMVNPKTPTPYSGDYLKVVKAEAPDDYTFVVHYKEPYAPAVASWGLSQLPSHLHKLGEDPRKSPLFRHPIGTGPYKFHKWEGGAQIEVRANTDYWDGRPNIDSVLWRIIPDTATQFLELKNQGIDYMGLDALQYQRQTGGEFFEKNFNKYKYLSSSYTYLGYNLRRKLFQDVRIRRALTYAIDKQEIVKGVLLGMGQATSGPYKPGTYWYNDNVAKYPYNPKKAKELFAQAGWTDSDGDGWLDKDGKRFEFIIITNQGNAYRANAGAIIQYRLAQIGIKVDLRIYEWATFLKYYIEKGAFDATILAWTIPPDPDLYDVWHSSKAKPGQLNFTYYINKEVDELLLKGQKEFDKVKRKAIYDRVQEILAEEQPYTFLYAAQALPIVHSRFKGIKPAPAGLSYNFIRWWVPSDLQRFKMQP